MQNENESKCDTGMTMTVKLAQAHEADVIRGLLQLHLYEVGMEPGPDGLIDWGEPLDEFFTSPGHVPLLFQDDNGLVGFALVRLNCELAGVDGKTIVTTNFMEEFFILRPHRRKKLGTRAADLIFEMYPGRWTVTCWPGHKGEGFWRHVATARPSVRGREFRPDEHKGWPGQCVWVIEPAALPVIDPEGD